MVGSAIYTYLFILIIASLSCLKHTHDISE